MTATRRGKVYIASRLVVDSKTVLSPGAVAVERGVVAAAGSPAEVIRRAAAGSDRIDLPGLALLPGLVNAHTHLSIPRLSGRDGSPAAPSLSFVDWILRVIEWKRSAPPGEAAGNVEAAAREAVACGTTFAGEIAGAEPAAYSACPVRARVFAEGVGLFPEVAGTVLSSVEKAVAEIARLSASGRGILPGISPHTLYTVGFSLLEGLAGLCRRFDLPAALHLAESPAEREFLATGGGEISSRLYPAVGKDVSFFRGIGAPLVAYLRSAGLLREGLVLVHNVHLSRREIDDLGAAGARFVLCPRSNRAHRNGTPDVTHFVDARVPFALGTDSLGSVPTLSMWDEMREAAGLYRGALPREELFRALFRAATENGARAMRIPAGTLVPGAPADFAAVDDQGGEDAGRAISLLVERTEERNVRLTFVGGERRHERP